MSRSQIAPNIDRGDMITVEVKGTLAIILYELNRDIAYGSDFSLRTISPNSREPTPSATAEEETVGYFGLSPQIYSAKGYMFGSSARCNLILRSRILGLSGIHFRIYVGKDRTWMLRNDSSNGTVVNGWLTMGSEALNSEEINVVTVQDLTLLVHIASDWIAPEDFISCEPPMRSRSSQASTCSFQPPAVPEFVLGEGSRYHVLKNTPIQSRGGHYAAVHRPTGLRCVAIVFDKYTAQRCELQYRLISEASSLSGFIVPYIDVIAQGPTIISGYIDGYPLDYYCCHVSSLDDSELLSLYRQGIEGLCCFQREGIKHGDISTRNIIITLRPFKVYFAGFSQCCKTRSTKDFKKDVADFSRAFQSVAIGEGCEGRVDPEIALLVNQALNESPLSALEINDYIYSLVGENIPQTFNFLDITKSWTLGVYRDSSGIFIETSALLDRLLSLRREVTLKPPREALAFAHLRDLKIFHGKEYCTSDQAIKICQKFRLEDFKRVILRLSSNLTGTSFRTKTSVQVAYHVPTGMINFTHVAEAIGWRASYIERIEKPFLQEVEDKKWGGTYIDRSNCEDFMNSGAFGLTYKMDKPGTTNLVLASQFKKNDSDRFILLLTGQLNPNMIVVRRADCFVKWSPYADDHIEFMSPEEACSRCDDEELPSLKMSIQRLLVRDRELKWSSWGPSLTKPAVISDYEDDNSTSASESDANEFSFRWRKG